MGYSVEELSAVKKKVKLEIPASEINTAISASVERYRSTSQMAGFRKGKVPAHIIEKRFKDQIYNEVRTNIMQANINTCLQELAVIPLGGIQIMDISAFSKTETFSFVLEFEILPNFELPDYSGLECEQEKVVITEEDIDTFLAEFCKRNAALVDVSTSDTPVDGQVANIDFSAWQDGKAIENFKADNFNFFLGEGRSFPAFEELVKSLHIGEEKEADISFPADFIYPNLAGKTVTMKVKLHAIKERKVPNPDDDFAKTLRYESLEKMRSDIRMRHEYDRKEFNKDVAKRQLIDQLLEKVDFPLPENLLNLHTHTVLEEERSYAEIQGKRFNPENKSFEELKELFADRAIRATRSQILLMSIAIKENLSVSDQELNMQLYRLAMQYNQDFAEFRQNYERTGMLVILRDRMLADKGMNILYSRAKITEVEPKKEAKTDAQTSDNAN